MARLFESFYRVKRRDNLGEPDYWNSRFSDVDRRLDAVENATAEIDALTARLEGIALDRINLAITPLVQETQTQLRSIANLFRAGSVTQATVSTGPKVFTILESQRNTFAALDYVSIRSTADEDISMVGRVDSYNRDTGELAVVVDAVSGTGTFISWTITISSPPDLVHAARTDNPHLVTAAQIGAATAASVTTAQNTAISTVRGGVSATYDTLQKLLTYLNSSVSTLTSQLAAKANTDHDHNSLYYTKSETTALVGATKVTGTVQLVKVTDTQIKLQPKAGGYLMINGVIETVPGAGVVASNSGLVNNTIYYVYCYKNGASLALDLSTTGYVFDSSGIPVKNGTPSRSLVGMVQPTDGGLFKDHEYFRYVRSWYNDKGVFTQQQFTADRTETATGGMSEFNGDIAQHFLVFKDEVIVYGFNGAFYNNTTGSLNYIMVAFDDDFSETNWASSKTQFKSFGSSTYDVPVALHNTRQVDGDYNISLTITGRVSAGTLVARAGGNLTAYVAPRK